MVDAPVDATTLVCAFCDAKVADGVVLFTTHDYSPAICHLCVHALSMAAQQRRIYTHIDPQATRH